MNNNSELLSRYLENEMTSQERSAFEERLSGDAGLQQELNIQRQIITAAQHAGIKAEFAKAIKHKAVINRSMVWTIIAAACILLIVVFNFRHTIFPGKVSTEDRQAEVIKQPFVDPPLPAANVPLSEYEFDAAKGTTIYHATGSVIHFPASALLDASGMLVKGIVKITYREFADPLDFFVSGIPMGYDSAGVGYNFESSGMCEINAYKDGKAVFVNKNTPPEIHLSGKNKNPLHNLYVLDTLERNWKFMGKDIITEVKNTVRLKPNPDGPRLATEQMMPVKPVRPIKASEDKPAFSIEIDPGSFEELFVYDRLKFQVEDESTYKPSDANEHWDNVKLDHTNTEGIYIVTFTNKKRTVSYKVRPVLDDADYDAALKTFNQKKTEYEQVLKNRLVKEQVENDSISSNNKRITNKMKADQEWNEKINRLIIARNKKLRELKKAKMDETEKLDAIDQKMMEDQAIQQLIDEKYGADLRASDEIMRSFSINRFGVWNCDQPQYFNNQVPLFAHFTDSSNNKIQFTRTAVVYGGINGIRQYSAQEIFVIAGRQNMIWSIHDGSLYYFTYRDFAGTNITKNTKEYTFRMRRSTKTISSYNEIRELVGQL